MNGPFIPDINKFEYLKLARAVIHLGVRITPSDSECASLNPCATPSVKTGFFLCKLHKHIDLKEDCASLNDESFKGNRKPTRCRLHLRMSFHQS